MEKGLKTMQTAARTAHRKAAADSQSFDDRGISDHNSDSGIGLGSDTEIEVGSHALALDRHLSKRAHSMRQQQFTESHVRSHSLPQLPLYQPPPPPTQRSLKDMHTSTSPRDLSFRGEPRDCSPGTLNGRISIHSIVSR